MAAPAVGTSSGGHSCSVIGGFKGLVPGGPVGMGNESKNKTWKAYSRRTGRVTSGCCVCGKTAGSKGTTATRMGGKNRLGAVWTGGL